MSAQKPRSERNLVLVTIPNETTFDNITTTLENFLPPFIDLRYAFHFQQIQEEAELRHVDVIIYIPKAQDDDWSIQRALVEMYTACPEAAAIIVTKAKDMGRFNNAMFGHEVWLEDVTAQLLAMKIGDLLAQVPVAAHG